MRSTTRGKRDNIAGGPDWGRHGGDEHGGAGHRHHPRGESREPGRERVGGRASECSGDGRLHIIGTDRHESRRIDNQLRGRAGRQGDPGSSRFYISVEDDLMRRFGGDKIKTVMEWARMDESTPMEHSWITKSVENAQKKVEGINFDIRKRLVDYDDVANNHRDMIYGQRRKVLEGSDVDASIHSLVEAEITETVHRYLRDEHGDEWDLEGLLPAMERLFPLPAEADAEHLGQMHRDEVTASYGAFGQAVPEHSG